MLTAPPEQSPRDITEVVGPLRGQTAGTCAPSPVPPALPPIPARTQVPAATAARSPLGACPARRRVALGAPPRPARATCVQRDATGAWAFRKVRTCSTTFRIVSPDSFHG